MKLKLTIMMRNICHGSKFSEMNVKSYVFLPPFGWTVQSIRLAPNAEPVIMAASQTPPRSLNRCTT